MVVKKLRMLWSMNGKDSPPDLDEIWQEITNKIRSLLGGTNRPTGPSEKFPSSGGGFRKLMGLLIGVVAVIWLASGFYIVDASEHGVVTRFGKYTETTEPGLHWHLPYAIEQVNRVNITGIRTVEIGYRGTHNNKNLKESLMLTDDENIVNVQFAIQFRVKADGAFNFIFSNRSADDRVRGEDWVRQVSQTAIREVIGKSKMDYVLYEGRDQIAAMTKELMQEILDRYDTGIEISQVTMQNAQPPENVQAAFSDAVKAGQDRERQKNEGQAYANDVVPKARGTESRLLAEAEGYRSRVVSVAKGDVARFEQILVEYNKAPNVTRQRIYIDTMREIMQNVGKVMVDGKNGNQLLYLPLDRLIQQGGGYKGSVIPDSTTGTLPTERGDISAGNETKAATSVRPQRTDRGGQ